MCNVLKLRTVTKNVITIRGNSRVHTASPPPIPRSKNTGYTYVSFNDSRQVVQIHINIPLLARSSWEGYLIN